MAQPSITSSPKAQRLHELLEEKQEPFFLDIYLAEKGYSTRFLDEAPIMCWPGNENRTLRKFTSSQFKRKTREGFLKRTLLSKFSRQKHVKGALNRNDTIRRGEFESSGRSWENKQHKLKQLSPVSVFDLSSYRSSPASHSEEEKSQDTFILDPKILDIFNQLLETAYTPEFERNLKPLDQEYPKRKPKSSLNRDNRERTWDNEGRILRSEENKDTLNVQRNESDLWGDYNTEMEKLSKKISKDIRETPKWNDFSSEIKGVATEIGDAILDDIILSLLN